MLNFNNEQWKVLKPFMKSVNVNCFLLLQWHGSQNLHNLGHNTSPLSADLQLAD